MKRLLNQIGLAGLASIALLAAALAFSHFVVKPLQERNQSLTETAGRQARKADASASGDKVAAVYEFLQKDEDTTDWLAKLHGIGVATGVQLKSANYRTQKTEGRIVRYEIVLPVAGSYPQIRDFLKRSLAEIPVLSVDSISLKRADHGIQAEMRLTLHMVKS
jgi:Tfp pilus assembly protein PilO